MSQRYYCAKCKNSFDEDEFGFISQYDGEGVMGGWHDVDACCPYCGSMDDWEEAEECCCCGEDFGSENYMIAVGNDWYCLECAKKIHDAYDEDQEKRRVAKERWEKMRNAKKMG
jgi:hypothetical protein